MRNAARTDQLVSGVEGTADVAGFCVYRFGVRRHIAYSVVGVAVGGGDITCVHRSSEAV